MAVIPKPTAPKPTVPKSTGPKPTRQWITPKLGDEWADIAATVFPNEPAATKIAELQSWNPHIVFRPPTGLGLLGSDVVFVEAPTGV